MSKCEDWRDERGERLTEDYGRTWVVDVGQCLTIWKELVRLRFKAEIWGTDRFHTLTITFASAAERDWFLHITAAVGKREHWDTESPVLDDLSPLRICVNIRRAADLPAIVKCLKERKRDYECVIVDKEE